MPGWQEFGDSAEQYDDDAPAVTLGDLRSGEVTELTVREEPEQFVSDQYGEGVRVPSTFHESDYAFRTEDGDAIEDGDDVVLVTWSKRLVAALADHAETNGGSVVGERVRIEKFGSGYDTDYRVEPAGD